ncbi:MAG TPA: glutamine synthetase beta-grasp domain-containing protein, partial [Actinomycetota bacterium]|nr:glutamine synthetase beta-grasp domain-containing protein [Actinomycetota bacterium]
MEKQQDYVLRTVEERGIRLVWLWFTDVLGFLKSFAVTSEELEQAFDEGIGFDGSAIEGFARVQESDMLARPDAATFQIMPAVDNSGEAGVARMFCDIYTPDGRPFWGDPRYVLRRNLAKAAERGFTFYVHPE